MRASGLRTGLVTVLAVSLALGGTSTAAAAGATQDAAAAGPDARIDCRNWRYREPDPATLPPEFDPDDQYQLDSRRDSDRSLHDSRQQHCGQRGSAVDLAWSVTPGEPDVVIAILDSGIEWRDAGAMADLATEASLNQGELTPPLGSGGWDANGDGRFDVRDYEGDPRVTDENGNGLLDPEDLILDPDFTNGRDDDRNGYVDDISGWDFLFDDNDPLDEVDYGHGTERAQEAVAAANGEGDVGACSGCRFLPVRVGDSFLTDGGRFAAGVLFSLDSGADVVAEALGVLNDPPQAQQAIDAAYNRGVPVVASMADEASKHANLPGALERTLSVNSMAKTLPLLQAPGYLELNGCTNYGGHAFVSVPSESCSSEATGTGSGIVGLLESAAREAVAEGTIEPADASGNALSANEVQQLVAATADDVDFATPSATDPANNFELPGLVNILRHQTRHPTTPGWDAATGYGRINAYELVRRVKAGEIPPEAELSSPRWFGMLPTTGSVPVEGRVAATRAEGFVYALQWAPGLQAPEYPGRDHWHTFGLGFGKGEVEGTLGNLNLADVAAALPDGATGSPATSEGLPDEERFSVRLRVVVLDNQWRVGRDQKQVFVHDDPDLVPGFPRFEDGVGNASPVFADLDGRPGDEMIVSGGDGRLHAYEADGREARGFPVAAEPVPYWHRRSATARADRIATPRNGFLHGAPVVADLDGSGDLEIAAADLDGNVYAWEHDGRRRRGFGSRWEQGDRRSRAATNPAFSAEAARDSFNRMKRGIASPPAAADLDGDGKLELVVAAMDRHVYAFDHRGRPVPGFPVLLVDPKKVERVDPVSHRVTFAGDAHPDIGGELIATPAVGDLVGDPRPEIVVGAQEQYDETPAYFPPIGIPGTSGNARLYALDARGTKTPTSAPDDPRHPAEQAYLDGWPVPLAMLLLDVLPTIGDGVATQAALGDLDEDGQREIVASSATGPVYTLEADGRSTYSNLFGIPGTLGFLYPVNDSTTTKNADDFPIISSLGGPTLGRLTGEDHPNVAAPQTGLGQALDVLLPGRQDGDPVLQVWDGKKPHDTAKLTGFPRVTADLGFFVSPGVADVDGDGRPEVLAGNGVNTLDAWNAVGEAPTGWPKLTGGWVVGTPGVGDWDGDGTLELAVTRRDGMLLVWDTNAGTDALGEWPRFGHDGRNSASYD